MSNIDEDGILRNLAAGGSIEYAAWPAFMLRMVARIDKIAHNEYPIPRTPNPHPVFTGVPIDAPETDSFLPPLSSSPTGPGSSSSSQENKENTPVARRMSAYGTSYPPEEPHYPAGEVPQGGLPPGLAFTLHNITQHLKDTFSKYPPHTIQRLAELVLEPKRHYRTLPTYLHALDRVVHVTSGRNIYPLPPAVPDMRRPSLLSNGVTDAFAAPSPWASPGSDEALGGALLTPIPWLQPNHHGIGGHSQSSLGSPRRRSPTGSQNNGASGGMGNDLEGEVHTESTETIDGPNGMGSIETVSVSVNGIPSMGARGVGVTQGELLRQEQRAGVVPVSQLVPSHHVHSGANPHAQVHRRASSGSPPTPESSNQAGTASSSSTPSEERQKSQSPPNTRPDTTTATAATTPEDVHAGVVGSVTGTEEEKPHMRGPEEIGPEDMGPQHASTSNTSTIGGPGGVEMQGIDVEAAVGRKANSPTGRTSSKSPPEGEQHPGAEDSVSDKMDIETAEVDEDAAKQEAQDKLEGESKKLKEDPASATLSAAEPMDISSAGNVADEGRGNAEGSDTVK
ncbi:hypothetical protein F4818DRAFT_442128 [Hypoxylon cercidicola]|nr:hypothetical protein F4818DRAFT_442128 [Hypoxylon cercidicola]